MVPAGSRQCYPATPGHVHALEVRARKRCADRAAVGADTGDVYAFVRFVVPMRWGRPAAGPADAGRRLRHRPRHLNGPTGRISTLTAGAGKLRPLPSAGSRFAPWWT